MKVNTYIWKNTKEYSRVAARDIDHHPPPIRALTAATLRQFPHPSHYPPCLYNISYSKNILLMSHFLDMLLTSRVLCILLEVAPPKTTICTFPRLTCNPIWGSEYTAGHPPNCIKSFSRIITREILILTLPYRDMLPDTSLGMYWWIMLREWLLLTA